MGAFYAFAGVNHFWHPAFYTNIMPLYFPWHLELVYLSGIAEILLGVGVCIERTRRVSAWLIVAMLLSFLPIHIDMLLHHADRFGSVPLAGLWLRLPLQGLFIFWAWRYTGPARASSEN